MFGEKIDFKSNLVERDDEVQQPRPGLELNRDEAQQITERVAALFSILAEWSRAQTPRRQDTGRPYGDQGARILELAQDAQVLLDCHPAHEKRRLLDIVFSDGAQEDGETGSTSRPPSELPADAACSAGNGSVGPCTESAGGMERFQHDRYYRPADPEMRLIATQGTLAVWRCEGRGPAYVRFGNRVLYEGDTLNQWLDAHRVEPAAA